jgi:glycosyltransferase involved in cell wall biosynthesis
MSVSNYDQNRKMKVAFVVHMLAPYRITFFEKLFNYKKFDWKLFAGQKTNQGSRPQFSGHTNLPVEYFPEKHRSMFGYSIVTNAGMLEAVKKFDPDIVIIFAHAGTVSFRQIVAWSKKNGKKVIMWTCNWTPTHLNSVKRIIRSFFTGQFYRKADFHITYSTEAKNKLIRQGYLASKIQIAYNGIDLNNYSNLDCSSSMFSTNNIPPNIPIVLYVGGFGKDKNVELLIKAWSILSKQEVVAANLVLLGNGPTFNYCKKLAEGYAINKEVHFLGRIENNLATYFEKCTAVVLPGTGGLVINEALFFERPVVLTKADGTEADLILNGFNGLYFQQNNAHSLCESLKEIIIRREYFRNNAVSSKSLITQRSNVECMVETFIDVAEKVKSCS